MCIRDRYRTDYADRKKPWGTGQAILCCKDVVHEPFLVINADDYYGKEAYKVAYEYLMSSKKDSSKTQICMVGFVLGNTLSENGSVTRGICKADEEGILTDIVETKNVIKTETGAAVQRGDEQIPVELDSLVSMNMWGMWPDFFDVLERGFVSFLEENRDDYQSTEYLLPTIVGELVHNDRAVVTVLKSNDKWFGVTYKEDKAMVVEAIQRLVDERMYKITIA